MQLSVPIWIGGNFLAPAVRRRIARWDGSCAYKGAIGSGLGPITPTDVAELRDFVEASAGSSERFDIKVSGVDHPQAIDALAEAGATWWGRWVSPIDLDALGDVIVAGPPRGSQGIRPVGGGSQG